MRRGYYSDPEMMEPRRPSACSRFWRYTWKTITCLFSHITLVSMVVSYCILGAVTFQSLEEENEKSVKRNISKIRFNITDELWKLTKNGEPVLKEDDFTKSAIVRLKDFEMALLKAITKDGWDGDENTENVQWSLAGALFYSIIVITTIGYGHIAPKTTLGKVVTIFYAILGIPLMLLCLSNIGDIMATSFRFLYWKVCCYVCTKKPKKRRNFRSSSALRGARGQSRSTRSRTSSFRRPVRNSTRSADSGYPLAVSYSDPDLRYPNDVPLSKRGQSLPRLGSKRAQSEDFKKHHQQQQQQQQPCPAPSPLLPPQIKRHELIDPIHLTKTPIYCNRYILDKQEITSQLPPGITYEERRCKSKMLLEPPALNSSNSSLREGSVPERQQKKKRYNPSPRIMSPLGYGHRSKYLDDPESDEDYFDEDVDLLRNRTKPVPIWLCVFLVISYIFAGTFLFSYWEGWEYLDSAYFCFITLTTIGFGDFVPAKRVRTDEFKKNIAFCSLYLLFGIALLAMSFNLVQEEVIANVKRVAKTLGIIKDEQHDDIEDSDDDY